MISATASRPGRSPRARSLEAELVRLGVGGPAVEVGLVDQLERQPTGKVRRFLPLTSLGASLPA